MSCLSSHALWTAHPNVRQLVGLTDLIRRCTFIHIWRCIVRTNVVLDESLVEEALKLSSAKTKKDLIHQALKEFVENRKRLNLLDLSGKIKFAAGYDYKTLREGK